MSRPEAPSIRELLRRSHEGDRQARKELFSLLGDEREFGGVMLSMARRVLPNGHWARRLVDTRDVVQSALRTGLRHFSDFGGETEGELCNWFRAILRTKVNRVARRKELGEAAPRPPGSYPDHVVADVVNEEFIQLMHAAIKKLSLPQRVVVELRLRGIDGSEIGRLLGLKPATVRKRESRAVENLKALVR